LPKLGQSDLNLGLSTYFRMVGASCAAQGVGLKQQQPGAAVEVSPAELAHALEECHRASAETPRRRAELDRGYKAALNPATNAINSCCLPQGLIKKFPANNLQLMVNSGAKVRYTVNMFLKEWVLWLPEPSFETVFRLNPPPFAC